MKYLQWNHIIGEYLFNQNMANREVLLYVTQKEISELGIIKFNIATEKESWADFCKAIKGDFPETSSKIHFIDKFLVVANKWKSFERIVFELNKNEDLKIDSISIYHPDNKIVYPFYLAYLIILIIPLTDNVNEFRANSFFPPLNNFLQKNGITNKRIGTIQEIDWVWNNLEKWSKEHYKTDLGYFTERRLGNHNWVYVNKAFSQCLLTPKNIRDIPNIFWKSDIAPNSIIPEKQFQRIITLYGVSQAGFSPRIISIVADEENPLRKVIIDIVKREYINWKGDVIEYDEDDKISTPKSGWVYATLLSAFNLNKADESFNHFYYLFSPYDFPDELHLDGNEVLNSGNGYSKPLAIKFNQSLNLKDDQNKWKASTTKNEIIIYTSGLYFGLPADNFIETDKISKRSQMYLLCSDSKKQSIEEWGSNFKKGDFNYIDFDKVPTGFNLFKFKNPPHSHPTEEILRITTKKKLEFRGGIRIKNRGYLKNLLPKIYIDGADGTENVFLEYSDTNQRISLCQNSVIPEEFIIPDSVICNQNFLVKIENENIVNSELPYQIIDIDFNPLDIVNENLTKRNCFGEISDSSDEFYVTGSNTTYNEWKRQASCSMPFFSNSYVSSQFFINNNQFELHKGNLILQILTMKRNLKFQEFSDIIDSIENIENFWGLSKFQQSPKYIKQTAISFYDYLGYLDYDYFLDKITINKPQFVIIPSKYSLKAILIGGHSKSFIENLQEICNIHEVNLEIIPQNKQLEIYYLPDLIRLTPANCNNCTYAWKKLQRIAGDLNIEFRITEKPIPQPQIIQFGLQDFSETIEGYKKNILANKFIEKPNYEWARKVFDINQLKFVKDTTEIDKNLSLQEYYVRYQYTHILWLDGKSYEVDRNWGKFLILSEKNKNIIYYNINTEELAIPKYIQLPRLIAESIMLLSGEAPYYKNINIDGSNLIYQFYQNVPKIFAENLFKKFNQNIQFKSDW
ncbi:hypothetical protein [Sediminibacterium goheungense]|uniref:Uncharacterized protein n=1 Tax=Sediminibacterium goheungense TaxID=1086393 RepID=A0A4R6J1W6_9BACT|nr:hypothetical protein [Sediminibacterium goheungense]TDO29252.1 hypothetical protein BC659_1338 [Sediminibacterium goheungense]